MAEYDDKDPRLPLYYCPRCNHYLMTNDPPGKLGWCQKCYKSVELKDKLKVD